MASFLVFTPKKVVFHGVSLFPEGILLFHPLPPYKKTIQG
jgi:hypothetical protein